MTSTPFYNIPKGSELVMDGRCWRVTDRHDDSVDLVDVENGECLALSLEYVERAIRDRSCDVTLPKVAAKRRELLAYTGGYERIEQLSEEAQRDVQPRLAAILAMEALEREGFKLTQRSLDTGGEVRSRLIARARKISEEPTLMSRPRGGKSTSTFVWPQGRTLMRYYKLFQHYARNPVVLADRDHLKGRREPRLSGHQERFIDYVLNLWMNRLQPKMQPLFEDAKTVFDVPLEERARGFSFPSITTIRTRLAAISEVVKTIGRQGVRHTTNVLGAGSTDVRALMFGEKFETDQVYLSIFTKPDGSVATKVIDHKTCSEELEENEVRRLWLHFMVDVATREPLAWIISETADADHSLALLRMATRDKTREKIRYGCKHDPAPPVGLGLGSADNGSATRNGSVYAAQLGLGGMPMTGRTYHAADKPYVERIFGTVQFQLLNSRPGYTGSRPGELKEVNPKISATLTHDEIYGAITRYLVDEYPHRPHLGTGMFGATVRQQREKAVRLYGAVPPPSQRDRCLHLGVKRRARTTSEGVKIFNLPFNSTELQRFADGQSKAVVVYLDPDDLRRVFITAEGRTGVIEAHLSMTVFNDLTLEEAIDVMEEATRGNPKLRALHHQHLQDARADRVRRSGVFPESRDPANYRTIEKLEQRAARLTAVSNASTMPVQNMMAPGAIMDRGPATADPQRTGEVAPSSPPKPRNRLILPPVTESKL